MRSSMVKSQADPGWFRPLMNDVCLPVARSSLLILRQFGPIAVASWLAVSPPVMASGDDHRLTPLARTNLTSGSLDGSRLPKSMRCVTGPHGNGYNITRFAIGLVA